ncbi:MAG TPA: peptidyl-prolyl cis-trans isomerase A [Firmicutes bacterium]|jgi:cyclophilin family peptidyl-prolyl cis-trans isomerase|nr:peptidyl-prolyl cis-trans isomerase A [Bacillota bacterium]
MAHQTQSIQNPQIILETTLGNIRLELYPDKAPITVENFLRYTEANFYNGTLFHRVIPDFMIQAGGFTAGMERKENNPPIKNEAANGISNTRGTIAMARTSVVDSATSEFFINMVDNKYLDHQNDTAAGFGYCVFGRVIEGMDVVDKIAAEPTGTFEYFQDVPVRDIEIISVREVAE